MDNPAISAHLSPRKLSLGEGQLVSGAVVQQVAGGKGHDVRVPVAPFPFTHVDACAVEATQKNTPGKSRPTDTHCKSIQTTYVKHILSSRDPTVPIQYCCVESKHT